MSFIGAYGVGVSDGYMLKSVGHSMCLCFIIECGVCFAAFDIVCDDFENGVWDVCLV